MPSWLGDLKIHAGPAPPGAFHRIRPTNYYLDNFRFKAPGDCEV